MAGSLRCYNRSSKCHCFSSLRWTCCELACPPPAFEGQDFGTHTAHSICIWMWVRLLHGGHWMRGPSRRPHTPTGRLWGREGPWCPAVLITLGDLFWRRRALPFFLPLSLEIKLLRLGCQPTNCPQEQGDWWMKGQRQEDERFGWKQDSDPSPFNFLCCDFNSSTLCTLKICKVKVGKSLHLRGSAAQSHCSRVRSVVAVNSPPWTRTPLKESWCLFWRFLKVLLLVLPKTRVLLSSVLSLVRFFATQRTVIWQASLSITNSWSLLKLKPIESVMPSNHLILCPLLLLPLVFPIIRVFSNESGLCIRRPKDWSFSFSISPFNEYSGLISFRIEWFDLAIQGTLRVFSSSTVQKHPFFCA